MEVIIIYFNLNLTAVTVCWTFHKTNGMLQHSFGRELFKFSLQHFIVPAFDLTCKPEAIGVGIAIWASLVQVGNKEMLRRKLLKSQSKECCIIFCRLEFHCSQSPKGKLVIFIWKRINKILHKFFFGLFTALECCVFLTQSFAY